MPIPDDNAYLKSDLNGRNPFGAIKKPPRKITEAFLCAIILKLLYHHFTGNGSNIFISKLDLYMVNTFYKVAGVDSAGSVL